MRSTRLPIELEVFPPTIILMGCQPNLMPKAPPTEQCPVCKGLIGQRPGEVARSIDSKTMCAQCDAMDPRNDGRIRGAQLGLKARDRADIEAAKLSREMERTVNRGVVLSEMDRRRVYNGNKGSVLRALAEEGLGNAAKVGRDWLASISQLPDFDLILDRRGRVVGRKSAPQAPDAS